MKVKLVTVINNQLFASNYLKKLNKKEYIIIRLKRNILSKVQNKFSINCDEVTKTHEYQMKTVSCKDHSERKDKTNDLAINK